MKFGEAAWFASKAEKFLVETSGVFSQSAFDSRIENAGLDILMPDSNTIEKIYVANRIDGYLFSPDNYLLAKVKAVNTIFSRMDENQKTVFLKGIEITSGKPYPSELLENKPNIEAPSLVQTLRNAFSKEGWELTKAANDIRHKSSGYLYKTSFAGHSL